MLYTRVIQLPDERKDLGHIPELLGLAASVVARALKGTQVDRLVPLEVVERLMKVYQENRDSALVA